MNNPATVSKMEQMKLYGMLQAFKSCLDAGIDKNYTADELIAHLIDAEWDDRYNRKLKRSIKTAKFRYQASFEELDFTLNRNLDKNIILRFSDCAWINKKQSIIITGPTGVGKSYIGSALGHQACILGFKVRYCNSQKLFQLLHQSKADGTYIKILKNIEKQDALIIDDFGLAILDNQSRLALLEIIEDRHSRKSTVIISQVPVKNWHEIIGDQTIADAICDRIIHNSQKIELKGDSVRKKYKNN